MRQDFLIKKKKSENFQNTLKRTTKNQYKDIFTGKIRLNSKDIKEKFWEKSESLSNQKTKDNHDPSPMNRAVKCLILSKYQSSTPPLKSKPFNTTLHCVSINQILIALS